VKRELLQAEYRELASKGYIRGLRLEGKVPGVLYGKGGESIPLTVGSKSLTQAMNTSAGMNVLLNLEIAGKQAEMAMIKELNRDMLKTGVLTHVDFVRVSLLDKIEVTVPVVLSGEDERAKDNGVVQQPLREVTILSVPDSIPESVPVDISGLKIGDSITVGDIKFPEGFEVVTDQGEMLVIIAAPRVMEDEAAGDSEEETAEEAETEEQPQ